MERATQYTYNWSNEVGATSMTVDSSEPEDNPLAPLECDSSIYPIYAIDPINDIDDNSSTEPEVGNDTPYSQPHRCYSPYMCLACRIHATPLMPFKLPQRYAGNQNTSDIPVNDIHETLKKQGKYQWMDKATQYTYNWSNEVDSISQQSSEPEDNPLEPLENDSSENPIYAIDPINDIDDNDSSEPEVGDYTPYSPTDSTKSMEYI